MAKIKSELAIAPNAAAAGYIRGKAVISPEAFRDLPDQIKGRAFTIARVSDFDVLRDVAEELARLPEGGDWREIRKGIAARISPFMDETEEGAAAGAAKAELLLRVHGFQAYAAARYRQQRATADALPYWQYLTVGDDRVRPEHAALDGKVLRADDPFWDSHYPPWDFGCRCLVAALPADAAEAGGAITGEQAERLAGGRPSSGYAAAPGELRMPEAALRERFGDLFGLFRERMEAQGVESGGRRMSAWAWMTGTGGGA